MKIIHTVVFCAAPGGGNPCPVVLHADGLTEQEMQKMTQEFQQESAFVMAAEEPDCDWRLRYFVPDHELTMCGHATIACAAVLVREGWLTKPSAAFETKAGKITVDWERDKEKILVCVNQFLPEYKSVQPSVADICRALGIRETDLGELPIEAVSTSRFKLMVPLKSREILDGLSPDFEALWTACDRMEVSGFYPFSMEVCGKETVIYARQFPNRAGYPEDPATGVAASALSAYLVSHQAVLVKPGWNRSTIYQGQAMGRPSILYAEVRWENGAVTGTRVCGRAEICSEKADSLG